MSDLNHPKLRWGILATGHIAGVFADGVRNSKSGILQAAGSRSEASVEAFGDKFDIPNRHPSYEALLADPEVDVVYIATPHPMHLEWAIKAAQAGKHLLCEKPIGLNAAQAEAIIAAARDNDVFLMEAFMYRCTAQTAKIVELVKAGAVGKVKSIEASFSFAAEGAQPDGRHLNKALGGGGILDVGGYPMSIARLIAGVANGLPFAEPEELKAVGHLGDTGVDEYTSAVATFPGGIIARLSCGVTLSEPIEVSIAGDAGRLYVPLPWKSAPLGGTTELHLFKAGVDEAEVIEVTTEEHLYGAEADTVARFLDARQAASPAMSWDDTLGLMRALDRWRAEIGLRYEGE
ncbi:MAG: putative dehydrogenase [Verrucomicrobiales bacterium]|jgi:predicted dehydrogenase